MGLTGGGTITTHSKLRHLLDIGRWPPYILDMKELMRTNNIAAIAFAKALLDGEGIDCFEFDVNMSVFEGSIGVLPRRVMVLDRDLDEARIVLRDNEIETGL